MNAIELIHELKRLNAKILLDGGNLKISTAGGALPPALIAGLKAHKEELVALLSGVSGARASNYVPIPRLPEKPDYALSSGQARMWVMSQLGAGSVAYNMTKAYLLSGHLDRDALQRAFDVLIERHESLRTVFVENDGEPRQKIVSRDAIGFRLEMHDLRGAAGQEQALKELVEREACRPFDLENGPLLRALLLQVDTERHVFVFNMHHIISDGWSLAIFVRELLGLYEAYGTGRDVDLAPLPVQYKDYAAWYLTQLDAPEAARSRAFWQEHLAGELPVLELPADRPRPRVMAHQGAAVTFALDARTGTRLAELARSESASLYMLLLAAVNVLLHRYSGQRDLIVGTPVSGRVHPDLEEQIGLYVNTLALRSRIEPDEGFRALLGRTRALVLAAMEHQAYPFDRLIDDLQLPRDMSRSPLFDVMVVYQGDDFDSESLPRIGGLAVSDRSIGFRPSKFDLLFMFKEVGGRVRGEIEYDTALFDRDRIERMIVHLLCLLDAVAAEPEAPVHGLDMLPESERRAVLFDHNQTDAGYPETATLVSLFEDQVARNAERIAVTCEGRQWTYGELDAAANRVARALRKEHDLARDDRVAVLLDRSEVMIAALLGVLKAGAAYVPIEPGFPQERIRYMLEDSQARALLTSAAWLEACAGAPCAVHPIEPMLAENEAGAPERIAEPADLAYVIYTSGTTGKPKGVPIEHRNVVRLLVNDKNPFELGRDDVWTMFHSYSFDFSVWEMYGALLLGGRLVVVPRATARDAEAFHGLLEAEKVTVLNQTPSAFKELLPVDAARGGLASLRYLIFGGESLSPGMLADFHARYPSCAIINMYGITETTVHVTIKRITAREIAANRNDIGLPLPTLTVYLLDEHKTPVPIGVPGEIWVGGLGVARGYLGRPELTAELFIQSPFRAGERLYRSGDLAVRRPDGELEHLGRGDEQVKVRGYRIELGEIENALRRHHAVKNAATVARRDAAGDTYLAAYIVCDREPAPVAEVRALLRSVLPDYMVPAYIVPMDMLPITSNGKIDKRALPEPDEAGSGHEATYEAPRTDEEKLLVQIWEDLLGRSPIGIHDNFFDLGGHSLKATRLVSRVYRERGVKLDLQEVFTSPTIEALARQLEALLWVNSSQDEGGEGNEDGDLDTITI